MKDSNYVKINSVNPLYLIFSKVKGYFEEINKNLALVPTNESKIIIIIIIIIIKIKNTKNCAVKSEV